MINGIISKRRLTRMVGALALGVAVGNASAAPGTLANAPLDTGITVPPNIMFLLDDSGSMDWDHMPTDRARTLYPNASDEWVYIDPTPSEAEEWRELCSAYNTMAFDPSIDYSPWAGEDDDGNTLSDVSVNDAPFNPYDHNSDTLDLENDACEEGDIEDENSWGCWSSDVGFFYVKWNDANGNGEYDKKECLPPRNNIPTDGHYYPNSVPTGGQGEIVYVKDMTADEKQNYANWFSYYRKKEYVAKRAISELISGSAERMGLLTLHDNGGADTPVKDVDDQTTPVDATAAANKSDLLDNLLGNYSNGGTPLRRRLEDIGEYFEGNYREGGYWGDRWPSPILSQSDGGSCQQNFVIAMTDGYWNSSSPDVGNADGDDDTDYDGASYADTYSNTLADVAMDYYERDLSNLPNLVPTSDADPADHQHMVTFGVSFGVNGTLSANPPNREDAFTWPEPSSDDITTIDDLRHAAWNGRGDYLSAKNPETLITALSDAYQTAVDRSATAAAGAFNGKILEDGSTVFVPVYNTRDWSGDMIAIPIDPEDGSYESSSAWSAANVLDARNLNTSPRNILSYNGSSGVDFAWGNIGSTMKADLRTNPDGSEGSVTSGQKRLAFLRGDRSSEEDNGGSFRDRGSRLGDIIHSAPVYVGDPELSWPDQEPFPTAEGERYSEFQNSTNRDPAVYVGANDGMLHGFDAETGEETMAYVPRALASDSAQQGLHFLTDPDYSHRYYVDQSPVVSDAYVNTGSGDDWRTLLIGSLRGGGRGLFALDVTSPSIDSSDVLWEFSSQNDADLGHTFSEPTVARLNNGEWAVIFGNGYNDSGSGTAQLFILFIEKGIDGDWKNSDYMTIDTGIGSTSDRNGLSTPVVADIDGDSVVDRVYAGDLRGNLWVFDLSDQNDNQWGLAYGSSPLFTAEDPDGNGQPITTQPSLLFNTDVGETADNAPNIIVTFGTGQYLVPGDRNTEQAQSYYGIWDAGTGSLERTDLVEQTFADWAPSDRRVLTRNPVNYSTETDGKKGWYFDLPANGERVVSDTVVRNEIGYFSTLIPNDDPCAGGGESWLMVVDLLNGGRPEEAAIDIDDDDIVDQRDRVTNGDAAYPVSGLKLPKRVSDLGVLGDRLYTFGDDANDDTSYTIPPLDASNTGRVSWQELRR
ncbi:Type IV pilus biogenesis factor PilY1 [wastewater metagenome]|uniref:Type IV pilus biogenesis factor PilY1 n=2 Tax=unclassified sequences TaxID=12908 RepID=A0A5B8RK01_9ZZZZ|nr:PilC/PilY family type IV pilus protein [Arhodomonas sp. KWT]QEA07237.1 type IV pilus biogenesis factor PilY1 [uncultured organism]